MLDVSVQEEACPLNLAPTASTTATLAMGDALAVALLDARGFTDAEFAKRHPSGSLGRQLMRVEELMRTDEKVPRVHADTPLAEGLKEISSKGLGMTVVVDDADRIIGVFTDGDLRRAVTGTANLREALMRDVLKANPRRIGRQSLAVRSRATDGRTPHHCAARRR